MDLSELKDIINESGIFQREKELVDIKRTMDNGFLLTFNKGRNVCKIVKKYEILIRLQKKGYDLTDI